MRTLHTLALAAALSALGCAGARAHGDDAHPAPAAQRAAKPAAHAAAHAAGQQGDPRQVTRTIRIDMHDTMRFSPDQVTVRKGETVRFAITNAGAQLHELVLGTAQEIEAHAALMRKHPGMEHDGANMAHVQPGKRGDIVWRFTQAGEFQFACLLPGHFEAGMVGKVVVK